jgi:hypothetical protein
MVNLFLSVFFEIETRDMHRVSTGAKKTYWQG